MLDKRLRACADFISGERVCDIGTDHAYLVAELLKSGRCKTAIAVDINKGPLTAARLTLERHGVISKTEIILSNGLEKIPLDGVTDIVIAGMGGELIAEILSFRKTELKDINLILQPMTHAPYLRRWLAINGFPIRKEKAIIDRRHYYTVINAFYNGVLYDTDSVYKQIGMLDLTDENAVCYIKKQAEKLLKKGFSLRGSKNYTEAEQYISLANKIIKKAGGNLMLTVSDIMVMMNKIAPLSITVKSDNSGLITGCLENPATKIILALDITRDVVNEAIRKGADVIISHHPVIFNPLYSLSDSNPACLAYKNGISCICFHSPLDMADGGINDIIYDMLKIPLGFTKKLVVLEPVHPDGRGYGMICGMNNPVDTKQMAGTLKSIFGCTVVRYTNGSKPIQKLAFCSGSGGANLEYAISHGTDAFITGDVKHNQFIEALNAGISLFDCGHYHTEVIVLEYLKICFLNELPDIDISIAESEHDPVEYAL